MKTIKPKIWNKEGTRTSLIDNIFYTIMTSNKRENFCLFLFS